MDSRQNMRNLLKKLPAERMGLRDGAWNETIQKWRAGGHLIKRDELSGEMRNVDLGEWFDMDMYERGLIENLEPIFGYKEVLEESEEWVITKNGAGAVFKNWKNRTGVPEHINFEMNSYEVWKEIYKPHLLKWDDRRIDMEKYAAFLVEMDRKKKSAAVGNLFVWEILRSSLGDVQMFEALLDDPDWIMDFNRTYLDFIKGYYKYAFEHYGIPDCVWLYDDLAYGKSLFCSPTILQECFVPFYREMTDFLHSYNVSAVLHSCGNVTMALPLIVESGFDALNPMEVKAGCDVVRFAEKYGDKLAFFGGFDVRILENGDKAEIKKEVLRICNAMRSLQVGYSFGTDHSITPKVEYESYAYAVEVFRDNSAY